MTHKDGGPSVGTGGAIALRHVPDGVDGMVLWAPTLFLDGSDVLADADLPEGAMPPTIPTSELAAVDVRVDILQGDEYEFPVANARELAAELPDAAVHVVEGADHSFAGGAPETEAVETTVELLSRPAGER